MPVPRPARPFYAYQVIVLDELARHGVSVRFTDAPALPDDPQARLLTQVQGVIAEYERAKIAERYRRGKLFRSRAGEVLSWRAPYGYRRVPRGAAGPARLEVFEPEAAVVRSIFDDRGRRDPIRQIVLRLAAGLPTPTGSRPIWGTSTIHRLLRNEAYVGRIYFNRTEAVPDPRPENGPARCPAPGQTGSRSPARHRRRGNLRGRRPGQHQQHQLESAPGRTRPLDAARPGQMRALRRGHQLPQDARPQRHLAPVLLLPQPRPAARRRTEPALPRTQHPRRRPRRVRLRPSTRRPARPRPAAGRRQAIAVHAPVPDDQLLAAELARLNRKLEAARGEHRRLVHLYQAGLIDMPELQRRAAAITARQRELDHKRASLAAERADLARGNRLRHGVQDFATRVHTVIDQLDPAQRQQLLRLLIEDVQVTGWHVKIRLRIPLDDPPDGDHTHRPTPQPGPTPASSGTPPVSTEARLRSAHDDLVAVVDDPVEE